MTKREIITGKIIVYGVFIMLVAGMILTGLLMIPIIQLELRPQQAVQATVVNKRIRVTRDGSEGASCDYKEYIVDFEFFDALKKNLK